MGVFEMVAIIVVAAIIGEMYQARLKTQVRMHSQETGMEGLDNRLIRIEGRLGNLEEVLLDREKEGRFE